MSNFIRYLQQKLYALLAVRILINRTKTNLIKPTKMIIPKKAHRLFVGKRIAQNNRTQSTLNKIEQEHENELKISLHLKNDVSFKHSKLNDTQPL